MNGTQPEILRFEALGHGKFRNRIVNEVKMHGVHPGTSDLHLEMKTSTNTAI